MCVKEYSNTDKLVPPKYPNLEIQERVTNSLLAATPIYDTKLIKAQEVVPTIANKLETNIIMQSNGPEFGQYTINQK